MESKSEGLTPHTAVSIGSPVMQKNESARITENESVIIVDAYGWPAHIIKCYLCLLNLTDAVVMSMHLCMINYT